MPLSDALEDLIADVRLLLDPQPAMFRYPTTLEIVQAAAMSGWLPPLGDPYLRPVLPPRFS